MRIFHTAFYSIFSIYFAAAATYKVDGIFTLHFEHKRALIMELL